MLTSKIPTGGQANEKNKVLDNGCFLPDPQSLVFPGTQLKEDYSMTMSSTPRLLMFLWS